MFPETLITACCEYFSLCMSSSSEFPVIFNTFTTHRKNCGQVLIDADRYSMQMRMLNIIWAYVSRKQSNKASAFIGIFVGLIRISNDAKKSISKMLDKTTALTFNERHQLLHLINQHLAERLVYSMPITSVSPMKFKGVNMQTVDTHPYRLCFIFIIA